MFFYLFIYLFVYHKISIKRKQHFFPLKLSSLTEVHITSFQNKTSCSVGPSEEGALFDGLLEYYGCHDLDDEVINFDVDLTV